MLKRTCWPVAVLLAVAAVVPLRGEIIEQVLVKVNGDILTLSEFEKRQIEALRQQPELAALPLDSPKFAQAVAETVPPLILSAVDELLWLQRAKEMGWGLTDETYARTIGDIRKENGLEDEARFKAALAAEGLSEAELRKNIERTMLIGQVQREEVFDRIDVTEGEIRQYYEEHLSEFTTPAQVTLREILIAAPEGGSPGPETDAARALAEQTRARLLAGEPFPRLAADLSSSASKVDGGLIGSIPLENMASIYQEMLSTMRVGDITEVVPSTSGFHILKLEARTEQAVQPLAEARDAVSRRVAEQKSQGEMIKYLERLRSQATIVWRHEELKRAYEQALIDRRARAGLPQRAVADF